ncbi:MAG: hypothetical protein D6707_01185 [Bacteroidetes bacterium]|nr:MAG: hypothetical protein D6707_01185 [Bacteroidota bacterium]
MKQLLPHFHKKSVFAGIFLILFLTAFLHQFFPVINYFVNYDYISKELCENKDKPELKCHGKCYLQKELKKTSDNAPLKAIRLLVKKWFHSFYFENSSLSFNEHSTVNAASILYINNYRFLFEFTIVIPPEQFS